MSYEKYFTCIYITLIFIQSPFIQIKVDKVPDRFPVQGSYLFSGELDSSQYKYFQNGILKEQFYARRDTLRSILKSRENLLLHVDKIKNEYIKLLGLMPDKTPLHPVVTRRIEKDKYTIEKVTFESRPNLCFGRRRSPGLYLDGLFLTLEGQKYMNKQHQSD